MIPVVDANVLVAAFDHTDRFHADSRAFLEDLERRSLVARAPATKSGVAKESGEVLAESQPERFANILYQKEQVEQIARRLFKSMMEIELSSALVHGVDQHGSPPDHLGPLHRPTQRIKQHLPAQAGPLLSKVDRQPAKEYDGDLCPALAPSHPRRHFRHFDACRSKAVIGDGHPLPRRDVRPRFSALLVFQGKALEEVIERVVAAIKPIDTMML